MSHQTRAELELLYSILDQERNYPWNPSESGADSYFAELEADWQAEVSAEEAATGWKAVSSQLEQLWSEAPTASQLQLALTEKFSGRMPQSLLQEIAQRAQEVVAAGRPLAEQLIHCVQEMMSAWDEADLQVMARPYAMAMRDGQGEITTVTLNSMANREWSELSDLEQLRLSLAIARYAITQLNDSKAG
ncbi:MAG: hypothetical protein QNJ46_29460 [Leptolyngbyaceae cyanobacterium MO_188.B28]|nr:hypothetical protein [Leptolyngbyaceae cyanobacterium MO_188.B28]